MAVALVAAATAACAAGATTRFVHSGPLVKSAMPWPVLFAAFILTETFPVHFEHRREAMSLSLSTIPLVVGLFVASPVSLVAIRLAASLGALLLRRQRGLKLAVNLSAFWVETATAVVVFRVLHGHAGAGVQW